jgi:hypothetical protein
MQALKLTITGFALQVGNHSKELLVPSLCFPPVLVLKDICKIGGMVYVIFTQWFL